MTPAAIRKPRKNSAAPVTPTPRLNRPGIKAVPPRTPADIAAEIDEVIQAAKPAAPPPPPKFPPVGWEDFKRLGDGDLERRLHHPTGGKPLATPPKDAAKVRAEIERRKALYA